MLKLDEDTSKERPIFNTSSSRNNFLKNLLSSALIWKSPTEILLLTIAFFIVSEYSFLSLSKLIEKTAFYYYDSD
jgi:hypothetical protein